MWLHCVLLSIYIILASMIAILESKYTTTSNHDMRLFTKLVTLLLKGCPTMQLQRSTRCKLHNLARNPQSLKYNIYLYTLLYKAKAKTRLYICIHIHIYIHLVLLTCPTLLLLQLVKTPIRRNFTQAFVPYMNKLRLLLSCGPIQWPSIQNLIPTPPTTTSTTTTTSASTTHPWHNSIRKERKLIR